MSLILFPINTERMSLAPATMKLYLLELHDRPAFASTLNANVPQEWPPDQITPEVIEEFIGRMQARDRKIWSFLLAPASGRGGTACPDRKWGISCS